MIWMLAKSVVEMRGRIRAVGGGPDLGEPGENMVSS
jgi:hypothetical protein